MQTSASGISDELWSAIARTRADYYVPRWKRYAAGEKTFPSWHWPALFVAVFWALYRKSWAGALGFLLIPPVITFVVGVLVGILGWDEAPAPGIGFAAILVIFLLPPILANGFYYRKARRLVAEALLVSPDPKTQLAFLTAKGGTSKVGPVLGIAFVCIAGILVAIALPAYQDYTIRARVSEAISATSQCRRAVSESYASSRAISIGANEWGCGDGSTASPYVTAISINPNGVITLVLSTNSAIGSAGGKTVSLTPTNTSDAALTWSGGGDIRVHRFKCAAGAVNPIPPKYLPGSCRQ